MSVLVDTNILVRLLQPHHPHCTLAEQALAALHAKKENLYLAAQNLVEFWTVVTRPVADNGLGFTTEQAIAEVKALKRFFTLLPEVPLLEEWERLAVAYRVSGRNSHDARLVAAMTVSDVGSILTFNIQDFARYSEIRVIDPRNPLGK